MKDNIIKMLIYMSLACVCAVGTLVFAFQVKNSGDILTGIQCVASISLFTLFFWMGYVGFAKLCGVDVPPYSGMLITEDQKVYYGQNGEDLIMEKLFPHTQNGFFVEVGSIDGRLFSNTLHFEERGWTGICVEAHADYIDRLIENRPRSIVLHCAIGATTKEEVTFYANAEGSLSTLDPKLEEKWRVEYPKAFTGFKEQKVRQYRLDDLFKDYGVTRTIDFLSIDIEGTEVDALRGLIYYRPKVILIEIDPSNETQIDQMLTKRGYNFLAQCKNNKFYGYRGFGRGVIENQRFEYTPIHVTGLPDFGINEKKILMRPSTKPTPVRDFLRKTLFAIRRMKR